MKTLRELIHLLAFFQSLPAPPLPRPRREPPKMNKIEAFLEGSRLKFLWTIKTELVWVVCAVAAFFLFGPVIRMIDPTAAPLDPGWLHFIFAALVAAAIFVPVVFIIINLSFPFLDRYIDSVAEGLERDWQNTTPAVRVFSLFGLIVSLFTGLVALALAFAK